MKKAVKSTATETATGIIAVALSRITVNGFNPRTTFNEGDLRELADSIKQVGVLQPVLVRPKGKKYEIVCGERRFRASVLANMKSIPAVVRILTDEEALEFAITENLQRKDVSPVEEATAYKRLADTGRYNAETLAVRFGKSETYIRNRMRLNDLTSELLNLVNQNIISVSIALELCRYGRETQAIIYNKHLQPNPDCIYDDWRNLTAKDFIKRIENRYSTDLSRYRFDKSECGKCPFNTNSHTLFPDEDTEGRCLHTACLTERNRQFLVSSCRAIIAGHPDIEVCRPVYNNHHEDVYTGLSEQGYTVDTKNVREFPECPVAPLRENFEDEADFDEAKADFYSEMADFQSEMQEIEQMLSEGKAKRIVTITGNEAEIGYVILPDGEENGDEPGKIDSDPIARLEKQDRRNREIAVERIVEETKQLIRNMEIPQSDFTGYEDKLLYFAMLSDLKREHFARVLNNPQEKWYLTDEDKIAVINHLTEEQKTLIRRDFLVKHLSDTFGIAKKSYLMLEFARLHFPDEIAGTETKCNGIYTKRHERITERLTALQAEAKAEDENAGVAKEVA